MQVTEFLLKSVMWRQQKLGALAIHCSEEADQHSCVYGVIRKW